MPAASSRRPIPAIVFLLALSLLTAVVWWRVLHRAAEGDTGSSTKPSSTCSTPDKLTLPAPNKVTVTVLNGNGKAGLAASVTTELQKRGFKTGQPGNDDPITGVGVIRYTAASAAAATLVHVYVPGARLELQSGTSTAVILSLGSTFKAVATAAQVKAALAKASTSPAPTC